MWCRASGFVGFRVGGLCGLGSKVCRICRVQDLRCRASVQAFRVKASGSGL